MNFVALDVETANADYSSICQIGVAEFNNGKVVNQWKTLVNPEVYFDPFCVSIHGISEENVEGSPTFPQVYPDLLKRISGRIVVHHMPFDKNAVSRACKKYSMESPEIKWLDSAMMVRRTWSQFSQKGYGLRNISDYLNIEFEHHDALEDAIAAGKVAHQSCLESNRSIEEWKEYFGSPNSYSSSYHQAYERSIKLKGNPDGPLYGENIVFTGSLSLPRSEASQLASNLGCNVGNSVTKKTTILVVGIQNVSVLSGYEKSSKHRKAEELISKGLSIKIFSEEDFLELFDAL